jgi:hypothetical protein
MRIIERVEPEMEHTCADCKSRLAVAVDDLRRHQTMDYGGDTNIHYRATCAVCLSEMDIPEDKIPDGWLTRVRTR